MRAEEIEMTAVVSNSNTVNLSVELQELLQKLPENVRNHFKNGGIFDLKIEQVPPKTVYVVVSSGMALEAKSEYAGWLENDLGPALQTLTEDDFDFQGLSDNKLVFSEEDTGKSLQSKVQNLRAVLEEITSLMNPENQLIISYSHENQVKKIQARRVVYGEVSAKPALLSGQSNELKEDYTPSDKSSPDKQPPANRTYLFGLTETRASELVDSTIRTYSNCNPRQRRGVYTC